MSFSGSLAGFLPGATWEATIEVADNEDGSLIDESVLDALTMTLELLPWRQGHRTDYGSVSTSPILSLSKAAGDITIDGDGLITWRAAPARTANIPCGLYAVRLRVSDGTDVDDILDTQITVG